MRDNTYTEYNESIHESKILNLIDDAIIVFNPKEILYINDAFEKIFSISKSEFIDKDKKYYKVVDENVRFEFENYNFDRIYNFEFQIKNKQGKYIWIRYKEIYFNKEISQKLAILSDITKAKENSELIEKIKLDFSSNISHELKTPINLIFSSAQLLESKYKQNMSLEFENEEYIQIIKRNSLRLLKMVNNSIDSVKLSLHQECLNYVNDDIVSCIEYTFNSIQKYTNEKCIKIVFDTDIEEKIMYFDRDKVERIILNLLSNAIKFNKKYGMIYLTISDKNKYIEIKIKDTGIGILPNKIDNIYDKFSQISDRMTKISEGSGLGLFITKSLLDIQGGTIYIDSVKDEGTEVTIKIPVIREDEIISILNNVNNDTKYKQLVDRIEIEFSDIDL